MIAALYVQERGVYARRADVDPWPEARDARAYPGPHPVVAHPECAAWGRYARRTPESRARGPMLGDDAGCFAAALAAVRRFGGVLEHPAASKAWPAHDIPAPPPAGWAPVEAWPRAYVCAVEQGHYGHAARKPTWLLYVGPPPPPLRWGASVVAPRAAPSRIRGILERMSHRQRKATPAPFAELLIELAARNHSDDDNDDELPG